MNNKTHTISAYYAQAVIAGAKRLNHDTAELLQAVGLSTLYEKTVDKKEAQRLAPEVVTQLIQSVWKQMDDEFMGFTSQPCKQGVFAIMARQSIQCRTLREALIQGAQFYHLIRNDLEVSFTEVCSNTTYECIETIRLEGSNGIAYKVEDLEVNTYLDTVDVTGKVYEPEVGYVLLDATSVEFCVADDNSAQLSAGTIVMEDEDGNQLEITVTACGEYDVNIIENNVFEAQQI